MSSDHSHDIHSESGSAAEHITEARMRARQLLSSEAHIGAVDDWRRTLVSARDTTLLIWLVWATLQGFGHPEFSGPFLTVTALGIALFFGVSTGRATRLQVQYFSDELERERSEIRDHFSHECEEVRALYAAKGFEGTLLEQVVDTLTSDDDRLLRVMMEEELGLMVHHVTHPLLVGTWNFLGSALVGLAVALPTVWLSPSIAQLWVPIGGAVVLGVVSLIAAQAARRGFVEFFVAGVMMAVTTGGVAFFVAQWLHGFAS